VKTTRRSLYALVAAALLGLAAGTAFIAPAWLDAASTWRLPVAGNPGTGDLVYGRDRNSLTSLAAVASGQVLTSAGTGTAPAWSATPTLTSLTLAGAVTGGRVPVTITTASTVAVGTADCGRVYVANAGSGTQTFTLPSAATAGCVVTIVQANAGTLVYIDAAADTDGFLVTYFTTELGGAAGATALLTEADGAPGIKNTAGNVGDTIALIADGGTQWRSLSLATGIWAAQ
jgi:hypothetical protein